MQFVKADELKPGMRLAKPIYNRTGVLLYERNTALTVQGISSIQNFGLIGIFILEPAEPVPPLTEEELEFEQFQTVYMFQLRDNMDQLQKNQVPSTLSALADDIQSRYGGLDHKLRFTQNLRSSSDYVYKHSISAAILSAMIANAMHISGTEQLALITAALLYDFGYLYVPQALLDKGEELNTQEQGLIQMNLERGYELIRPRFEECELPRAALTLIQQIVFRKNTSLRIKAPSAQIRLLTDILLTADRFDRLTAMNLNQTPVSEMAAMAYLKERSDTYPTNVVTALAECIHILPTGACVDLSDGEKALVLEENSADFTRPMVLKFSNNKVYDLSDPSVGRRLTVTDIMKTMDNRISIDEETLKHFVADDAIRETAERFRRQKQEIARRRQQREQQESMNTLLDGVSILPEEHSGSASAKRTAKGRLINGKDLHETGR